MANIYKARIELEVGLPQENQRDTLVNKLVVAKQNLIDALPTGSIIPVSVISKWDELELTVPVVERVNKQVVT